VAVEVFLVVVDVDEEDIMFEVVDHVADVDEDDLVEVVVVEPCCASTVTLPYIQEW